MRAAAFAALVLGLLCAEPASSQLAVTSPSGLPAISIQDAERPEGHSGMAGLVFHVSISEPAVGTVTVEYATSSGTALAGSDFVTRTGVVRFTTSTLARIEVPVIGDTLPEPDETFEVRLLNPVNAVLSRAQAVGRIVNDDTNNLVHPAGIELVDASVYEGNEGTRGLRFEARLVGTPTAAVSFAYSTRDGTATAGTDYTAQSGVVEFGTNRTRMIEVVVNGDTTPENTETLQLVATNSVHAGFVRHMATGAIINDDAVTNLPSLPSISVSDASRMEGHTNHQPMYFQIQLSTVPTGTVSVRYATGSGSTISGATATPGSDFVGTTGIVVFTTNRTVHVPVAIIGDLLAEPNETFELTLSSPVGATILRGRGIGTIVNDDAIATNLSPKLAISDAVVTEGHTGLVSAVFEVRLSSAPTGRVSVSYATVAGSATAGADYAARTGTVTFTTTLVARIEIPVIGDRTVEPDEYFLVRLGLPSGATISDGEGRGTIRNDDVAQSYGVTLRLHQGRNLIGAPDGGVAVSNIVDLGAIIVPGSIIGWDPAMQVYQTNVLHLMPYRGYWVDAVTNGTIFIPVPPPVTTL